MKPSRKEGCQMLDKPTKPCYICGSTDYYLRKGPGPPEWLCKKYHPEPGKSVFEDDVGDRDENFACF